MSGPDRGRWLRAAALAAVAAAPAAARAEPAFSTYKTISPDLALEIAQASLKKCREDGLQVAIVVMDRFGQTLVLLRDRYAGPLTATTATSKAYTALSFRLSTSAFMAAIASRRLNPELGRLPNVVMMEGGLPIEAGGTLLGAVGVSGANGGDKDETCARAGLDAVQDKLDF